MSDPARDAAAPRHRDERESVYEEYEPVVLWVKPGRFCVEETGKGMYPIEEIIRKTIRDEFDGGDFIDIATRREPGVEDIVTEFDTDE